MILTKRFWIVLITLALIGILILVFKNKIIITPHDTMSIDASSAEIYGEHKYDNGESLYHRYCYSCHGDLETDENGTGTAPPLNQFGNVWKLSSNNIAKKILFSSLTKSDSKMPSFAGMLKQDQIKDIITYIIYGLPKPYIKERQRLLKITLPKNLDTIHEVTDDPTPSDLTQTPPEDKKKSKNTSKKNSKNKKQDKPTKKTKEKTKNTVNILVK